jgi:hypothetical protein
LILAVYLITKSIVGEASSRKQAEATPPS